MARTADGRASASRGPPDPEAVAARRRRAAEEALDVRVRTRGPPVVLEVRNPVHRTSYRVLLPAWPALEAALCTCTDYARRGLGTCKHLEAGARWLAEHPDALASAPAPEADRPPADIWAAADRRLSRLRRVGPTSIRDVERVGAVLFENDDDPGDEPGRTEEEVGRGRGRAGPTPTSRGRP